MWEMDLLMEEQDAAKKERVEARDERHLAQTEREGPGNMCLVLTGSR